LFSTGIRHKGNTSVGGRKIFPQIFDLAVAIAQFLQKVQTENSCRFPMTKPKETLSTDTDAEVQ
jgi:hypothetical protein